MNDWGKRLEGKKCELVKVIRYQGVKKGTAKKETFGERNLRARK